MAKEPKEAYELMDHYTSDDVLATSVIGLSSYWYRKGYAEGLKTGQGISWTTKTVLAPIAGVFIGFILTLIFIVGFGG